MVAGDKGLNEPFDYINIQEFALKSERIKKHGILLTTFASSKNIEEMVEHIRWLHSKEIRALGIHTLIIKEVPEELTQIADLLNFPLFLIPENISYQQVMQTYYDLLVENTNEKRLELEMTNRGILESVTQDKGPKHVISVMGSFLDTPLILLDKRFNIKAYWTNNRLDRKELRKVVEEVISDEEMSLSKISTIEYITTARSNVIPFQVIPLSDHVNFYGVLLIGVKEDESTQESVIHYGKTALLLESMKTNASEKYFKSSDIKTIESILISPKEETIDKTLPPLFSKGLKHLYIMEFLNPTSINKYFDYIQLEISKGDESPLIWILNEQILCITNKPLSIELLNRFTTLFEDMRIGISDESEIIHSQSLLDKYHQSIFALKNNNRNKSKITAWSDLGFHKFLYAIDNNDMLRENIIHLLQPLIDRDKKNNSELLKTLHVYLKNFFSLKRSADELYIHKNTVRYRIDQIQSIYKDIDFENHDTFLLFSTSLKTYQSLLK